MSAGFELNQRALLGIATLALLLLGLATPARALIELEGPGTVLGVGERRLQLIFLRPADTDIAGYKIYARGNDGSLLPGAQIPAPAGPMGTAHLLVEADTSYTVWMTSYRSSGEESGASSATFVPPASDSSTSSPPPASTPPPAPPEPSPTPADDPPAPPPPPTAVIDPTLQHWWRLGLFPSLPGHDFGTSHILLSLDAGSTGISSSDIKSDSEGPYIDFNGIDEQMRSVQSPIDLADVWSLSIWLRPDNLDKSGVVFEAASATGMMNNLIRLELAAAWAGDPVRVTIADRFGTTMKDRLYSAGLQSGSWIHLVVVYDRGYFKLYADGETAPVLLAGVNRPGSMTDTARMISVGKTVMGTSAYSGEVASVAMWDVALTDQDIEDIYAGGNRGFNLNQ